MKQFIKDYFHDPDVHGGTNMWLLMYLIGTAICFLGGNFIVSYILFVLQIPFMVLIYLFTGEIIGKYPMPNIWIVGIVMWILFTIWWVLDGIMQYQKHLRKRNR